MKAQRDTILKAIERTMREVEDPMATMGLAGSARRYLRESWSEAEMLRDARRRLTVLRKLITEG